MGDRGRAWPDGAEIHDASIVRSRWYKAVLGLFERYDLLALPSAQVFAFEAETHWPSEIAGRKMDSYHRWMEVTALATMAGCPVVERAGRLRHRPAGRWGCS